MKTVTIEKINKPVSLLGMGTMIFAPNKKDLCFSILDTFIFNGGTLGIKFKQNNIALGNAQKGESL